MPYGFCCLYGFLILDCAVLDFHLHSALSDFSEFSVLWNFCIYIPYSLEGHGVFSGVEVHIDSRFADYTVLSGGSLYLLGL